MKVTYTRFVLNKYVFDIDYTTNKATIHGIGDLNGVPFLRIPDSVTDGTNTYPVTAIGANAFKGSEIVSVMIPASVETIGDYAFANTRSLTMLSFASDNNTHGYTQFFVSSTNSLTFVGASKCTTIGGHAFEDSAIDSIAIPASVLTIGVYAFAGTTSLTSVCTFVTINAGDYV